MADNSTYITGAATGAFVDALDGLPPWATERTAKNIEGLLNRTYKLQTTVFSQLLKKIGSDGTSKGMSSDTVEKTNKDLKDFDKQLKEAIKDKKKQHDAAKKEEIANKKKVAIDNLTASAQAGFNAMLIRGAMGIEDAMKSSVSVFDDLYRSGIDVVSGFESAANGFQALQQITTLTGVRYTELADIMKKYSSAVNVLGAERFAKAISASSKALTPFGYSAKESAELLGAYLQSQQGYTDATTKTQAQLDNDLIKFGKRVTALSQATGMSREKLLQNIDAISQSIEANLLASQVGIDATDSTMAFIGSFKDQKVGNAFLKMMTDSIKPLNDTFMNFQKTGFGGFGQKLMGFTQNLATITDPEEKQRAVAEFMRANQQEVGVMMQRANLLKQAGVQEANGVMEILTGMQQQARGYKDVSEADRKRMKATSDATKKYENAMERLQSQFQKMFAATIPLLNAFTWAVDKISDFIEWVDKGITGLESWVNSFKAVTDAFGAIDLHAIIGVTAVFFGLTKAGGYVMDVFKLIFQVLNPGKTIMGSLFGALGRLGGLFLRFAGPIGLLYTAFQLGSSIGEVIYETLSEFQGFNDAMDVVFSSMEAAWASAVDIIIGIGGFMMQVATSIWTGIQFAWDTVVSALSGLANLLPDSITGFFSKVFEKFADKMGFGFVKSLFGGGESKPSATQASAPAAAAAPTAVAPTAVNTPAPSTLNSPSQVSAKPATTEQAQAKSQSAAPLGPGIDKSAADPGINNAMMAQQNSLLEQLLMSMNSLASTNKDILKYTRVHS